MDFSTRTRRLRSLAWACSCLMFAVVAASAWIRLAQPHPACSAWPECRQHATADLSPPLAGVAAARSMHRVAASALLPAAALLAWLAWPLADRRRAAIALLALGLGLAALGVAGGGSRASAVLLGNQLGGWLMLALAWRLTRAPAMSGGAAQVRQSGPPRLASVAVGLYLLQAALGALSGAGVLASASPLHVLLAVLALPLAGWCAWQQRHGLQTGVARALLLIVALQALSGAASVAAAAAAPPVWLHAMLGACGFALLLGLRASAGLPGGTSTGASTGAPAGAASRD